MKRASWLLSLAACALAMAVACSKQSPAPAAPSPIDPALIEANTDGSLLKVSAPTPQSPINGVKLEQGAPVVLVVANSTTTFSDAVALSYRFEVMNAAGTVVDAATVAGGSGTTSRNVDPSILEGEQTYSWRCRPEYQGVAGPWSPVASFVAAPNTGYIRGSELYDPLIDGKTIGEVHGPVRFIPGQGVQMLKDDSFISYSLPQTLIEGEYSALVSGLTNISATEDPKWRVLTMREGDSAINNNEYRMSVDKRGNGAIAWRFISGSNRAGAYIETVGAERVRHRFQDHLTYLVRASWFGGFFRVQFVEGGVDGTPVYDFGKPYRGLYQPTPHNVFIGSPYRPGDRGEPSSVVNMTVRQVWVSSRPRPAFANK